MATETSAGAAEELASTSVSGAGANYRIARLVAVVAGLLGALLAIATPVLPVNQTTAQLNWPQNGTFEQRRGAADRLRGHRTEHQRAVPGGRRTDGTAERG